MKRLVFLALGMYCLSACGYVIAYREMQVANDKQALVRDYRTCVESHQTDPSVCSGILEGLNSTVTATLSGQIVMEGFLDIRLPGWARRLITRSIAIVPAAVVTIWYGAKGSAELLIMSQVVLSLQLPFAIVPLVMFTADRRKMGALVAPRWMTVLAILVAAIVIVLNLKVVIDILRG